MSWEKLKQQRKVSCESDIQIGAEIREEEQLKKKTTSEAFYQHHQVAETQRGRERGMVWKEGRRKLGSCSLGGKSWMKQSLQSVRNVVREGKGKKEGGKSFSDAHKQTT
jgi:hypothetical protein